MMHRTRRTHPAPGAPLLVTLGAALGLIAAPGPLRAQLRRALPAHAPAATAARDTVRAARDTAARRSERDAITVATREYAASGIARTVVQGNFASFPFGHAQPTLICTVLRACVIELESGEVVLSRISGDTERWGITPAPSGPGGPTALIVAKPH